MVLATSTPVIVARKKATRNAGTGENVENGEKSENDENGKNRKKCENLRINIVQVTCIWYPIIF